MIKENIEKILSKIKNSAQKCGRDPDSVKLVAVSKTFPAELVIEAVNAGLKDFGENYVQDFLTKYDKLEKYQVKWHFIGHVQTNKVKYIYDKISLLHTLDSVKLAEKLNKKLTEVNRILNALIQINIGREPNKYGIFEEEVETFLEQMEKYKHINITGFMTIPPFFEKKEEVRPLFAKMRMLLEKFSTYNENLKELSMGMSHDFDIAIEEGATIIRIGTAIFGERKRRN